MGKILGAKMTQCVNKIHVHVPVSVYNTVEPLYNNDTTGIIF